MRAWVDSKDIAFANYVVRSLYNAEKKYMSFYKPLENSRLLMIEGIREEYIKYVDKVKKELDNYKKMIQTVSREYGEKYYHVAYANTVPFLRSISTVFVAFPPQATTLKQYAIPPSAYINTLFIPITKTSDNKKITTLVSKVLYKHFVLYRRYHIRQWLEKHPRLKLFVEKKTQQYISRGQPQKRAWKNALRDMLRIIIGNIWLVGIYYLVKEGSIEPEDIILPYELVKEPELHKYRIDPKYTADTYLLPPSIDIDNITWKWLIKTIPKQQTLALPEQKPANNKKHRKKNKKP